ncbi:hypothetical protein BJ508DRAFT_419277 [Ascobolus immersus RN42]|uniref:Roadblock/LAMTOR2 domain-containing protein n=1 Tax=Ascobolus immersus RN42 TaxID=1160509 RepID=A0A3N4HIP2_ASCIM|nr:hypothetical protein BJ508DRAFT_419277 [Ascobolus immersus RN42]
MPTASTSTSPRASPEPTFETPLATPHPNPAATAEATSPHLTALLSHLLQKPNVNRVLILSRSTGSILRNELVSSSSTTSTSVSAANALINEDSEEGQERVRKYAGLVWRFVKMAGEVAEATEGRGILAGEEEEEQMGHEQVAEDVKLLRLRSGKKELVVVPDAKFILVVVHDVVH